MQIKFPNLGILNSLVLPTKEETEIEPFILIGKSGIKIKKKNRGKFTEYCGGTVTDACILRGKNSSDPAVRKRATFAANARAWKHQNGGNMELYFTLYKPYEDTPLEPIRPSGAYIDDTYDTDAATPPNIPQLEALQETPDLGFSLDLLTYSNTPTTFNISSAILALNTNAHNASIGRCALYVRLALEAGGIDMTNRPGSAYLYNNILGNKGFTKVTLGQGDRLDANYKPLTGDIVVIGKSAAHPHGHIAMYNGLLWISDFKQKTWHGLKNMGNSDYTIWRM